MKMFSITHVIHLSENLFWIKPLGIGKYLSEDSNSIIRALKYMVVSCNDFDTISCYNIYNEFKHERIWGFRMVRLTMLIYRTGNNLLYRRKLFPTPLRIIEKLKRTQTQWSSLWNSIMFSCSTPIFLLH